jgi:hypothetical protein
VEEDWAVVDMTDCQRGGRLAMRLWRVFCLYFLLTFATLGEAGFWLIN